MYNILAIDLTHNAKLNEKKKIEYEVRKQYTYESKIGSLKYKKKI